MIPYTSCIRSHVYLVYDAMYILYTASAAHARAEASRWPWMGDLGLLLIPIRKQYVPYLLMMRIRYSALLIASAPCWTSTSWWFLKNLSKTYTQSSKVVQAFHVEFFKNTLMPNLYEGRDLFDCQIIDPDFTGNPSEEFNIDFSGYSQR